MEQIFALMTGIGAMMFLFSGISINSIEAQESELFKNILSGLVFLSMVSFVIGFSGLILINTL